MTPDRQPLDLDACAQEPIRIPGAIQPHGALLVLDPKDFAVLQASENAAPFLGIPALPGQLRGLSGAEALEESLRLWMITGDTSFMGMAAFGRGRFHANAHRSSQGIILELEPAQEGAVADGQLHPRLQRYLELVEPLGDVVGLATEAAREVRALTGFGRVLVYRFDAEWSGTTIAEVGDGTLPSYLDLRFPASDIPAQARELYRQNRLRLIPDADYTPVPVQPVLSPVDGAPLDLSGAMLRSVSPVHLEYMRNMGTWSSMSISIVVDGRLWGLISCHDAKPWGVDVRTRATCEFIGRILAMRIGALQRADDAALRVAARREEASILERLGAAADLRSGLSQAPEPWLRIVNADGVAVVFDNEDVAVAGTAPDPAQIKALAHWLRERGHEDVYVTDRLPHEWPAAADFGDVASGLLAVATSQLHAHYVMWFRPEVIRTVRWAGNPAAAKVQGDQRLHPRRSFESWKEQVRLRATPWHPAEIEAARDFRGAIVNFVLRRAEERAALTDELVRSNKELEAFSYSVSHDLRAPFRHIAGFAELLSEREKHLDDTSRHYLEAIVDSALSAGRLVDDLLAFSQLGRAAMSQTRIDMNKLVAEVRHSAEVGLARRRIEWQISRLPHAWGDAALLRQALANLIGNALKYTRGRDPAVISVRGEEHSSETVYFFSDNGVGFDMAYVSKIFGVFQRLHRTEDFEGTGIGLALTKRVIDRHGGWIKAEGQVQQGATFSFGLPTRGKDRSLGRPQAHTPG